MRVLVTGSRQWNDARAIMDRLADYPPGTVLVHGDARGADRMAQRIGQDLGLVDEPHPADWTQYGKAAGRIRNAEMVRAGADICIAFPLPDSVGTWDCVRRAKTAGIPVEVVLGPGIYEIGTDGAGVVR